MRRSLSQQLMLPSMNSTLRSVNGAVRMLKGLCLLSKVSLWSCRSLRRYGYWNCRRCRCQSECTTTKALYGMILILIFAEALSLYGLIVGIILSSRAGQARVERTLKVS
ncbi:unnamed protein product [Brassica rapa subsp. narinosa]|uniref:(rape) hypothetical protein n=1 Tax=Brassica napus TaxID=3708 RepID=A0A816T6J5_BRANA|nr:unnamed protein product [Brassica napus]